MTSSGLCAPTYTRPNITRNASRNGTQIPASGISTATMHAIATARITWPDGKLGPWSGTSRAAQHRAGLAGPRPLAHREQGPGPVADDALGEQLHRRGDHRGCRHRPARVVAGDGQAGERAHDEVAELHRRPQRPVQPPGKAVDRPEHPLLERRGCGAGGRRGTRGRGAPAPTTTPAIATQRHPANVVFRRGRTLCARDLGADRRASASSSPFVLLAGDGAARGAVPRRHHRLPRRPPPRARPAARVVRDDAGGRSPSC